MQTALGELDLHCDEWISNMRLGAQLVGSVDLVPPKHIKYEPQSSGFAM